MSNVMYRCWQPLFGGSITNLKYCWLTVSLTVSSSVFWAHRGSFGVFARTLLTLSFDSFSVRNLEELDNIVAVALFIRISESHYRTLFLEHCQYNKYKATSASVYANEHPISRSYLTTVPPILLRYYPTSSNASILVEFLNIRWNAEVRKSDCFRNFYTASLWESSSLIHGRSPYTLVTSIKQKLPKLRMDWSLWSLWP